METMRNHMAVDWKLLSYAMFISVIIVWISAVIVSVLFIQPSLDMWRGLPQILSGNVSYTFVESSLPNIPLWVLLIVSLLLWCGLTIFFYVIMKSWKKMKKEKKTTE
jgi:preprotein translocase subunit SecG